MKKRICILLSLGLILTSITGCSFPFGKAQDKDMVQVVQEVAVPEGETSIYDMSKNEILALSAEEVEHIVTTQLPNYRKTFKIDEDRVMSESDWLSIREIICLQLFGSAIPDKTSPSESIEVAKDEPETEKEEPVVEEPEKTEPEQEEYDPEKDEQLQTYTEDELEDPDRIYYAPTYDEIYFMTYEEFAEYLNGMYAYFYPDETGLLDFHSLSDEELQTYKDDLLESIKANN